MEGWDIGGFSTFQKSEASRINREVEGQPKKGTERKKSVLCRACCSEIRKRKGKGFRRTQSNRQAEEDEAAKRRIEREVSRSQDGWVTHWAA